MSKEETSVVKKPTLLIIEDDLLTLRVYQKLLSHMFEIITCATVTDYRTCVGRVHIDIFIIDISLQSDVDGLQLIRELRGMEEYKNIPIIVITAHAFIRDERNAKDAGATSFVRKPIDNKSLLEELAKYSR